MLEVLEIFYQREYLPILIAIILIFLILYIRPSILVYSKENIHCPLCINPWLTTLIVLITSSIIYYYIFK
jgi:hypothetical protein